MGTSQPRLLKRYTLSVFVSLAALLSACKSSTSPEPPEPPLMVSIRATVNADYTIIGGAGGAPVTNGRVRFEGNSQDKAVNLGETVELGQAEQGKSKLYKITITGDNVHTAIFNDVKLVADGNVTGLETDVIDTRTVDIGKFIWWILCNGNINWRWDYKGVLQLSFNPDAEETGARLPNAYIIETENTVALIAQRSNGIIGGAISNRNGNYASGTVPNDGECRTFYSSNTSIGVGNVVYPINGDRVKSCVMLINPAGAQPFEVPGEVIDAFWQGNQNISPNNPNIAPYIWQIVELSFKRPAGNDQNYKIFADHEERTGWPTNTTSSITHYPGNTVTATFPHSRLSGVSSDPATSTPTGPARPATKDRIPN